MLQREWTRAGLSVALVATAVIGAAASAGAQGTTADLRIVSVTVDHSYVRVGDRVEFTAVAEDHGPDPIVGNSLDVSYRHPVGIDRLREFCSGGISPDTPFCEFGEVRVGQRVAVRVSGRVVAHQGDYPVLAFCVSDESSGQLTDPNPSNNCGAARARIVGPH